MLASEIDQAIAILSRGCEGIEAVMSGHLEANRFTNALEDLPLTTACRLIGSKRDWKNRATEQSR
jgi:hypothetical protein